MNLAKKVKDLALSSGMDYVGVAPVDRFRGAPEGWRPSDLLKNCKSVVSVAIGIGEGVRQTNRLAYGGLRHAIYIYMMFGYAALTDRLNEATFRIAKLLEKEGYASVPIPASSPFDQYLLRGVFSLKHAAVAAGLGEFGWNNLLLTPEKGAMVRPGAVLTEAELEPDPMYSGKPLCNREKCGFLCVKVCPMRALSKDEGVKLEIGGRASEYAKMDKWRCMLGYRGLSIKALGRTDIPIPEYPKPEDYLAAAKLENPWQTMEKLGTMCGRCQVECPAPII